MFIVSEVARVYMITIGVVLLSACVYMITIGVVLQSARVYMITIGVVFTVVLLIFALV